MNRLEETHRITFGLVVCAERGESGLRIHVRIESDQPLTSIKPAPLDVLEHGDPLDLTVSPIDLHDATLLLRSPFQDAHDSQCRYVVEFAGGTEPRLVMFKLDDRTLSEFDRIVQVVESFALPFHHPAQHIITAGGPEVYRTRLVLYAEIPPVPPNHVDFVVNLTAGDTIGYVDFEPFAYYGTVSSVGVNCYRWRNKLYVCRDRLIDTYIQAGFRSVSYLRNLVAHMPSISLHTFSVAHCTFSCVIRTLEAYPHRRRNFSFIAMEGADAVMYHRMGGTLFVDL